jgi:hypothetical protein
MHRSSPLQLPTSCSQEEVDYAQLVAGCKQKEALSFAPERARDAVTGVIFCLAGDVHL